LNGKKPYMHLTKVGDELIAHDRYRCKILKEAAFDHGKVDDGQHGHRELTGLLQREEAVYLNVQSKENVIVVIAGSLSAGFGAQQPELLRPALYVYDLSSKSLVVSNLASPEITALLSPAPPANKSKLDPQ